ncbi:MAG: LLM class oxidoreductase [Pseudomonadota bacterium]
MLDKPEETGFAPINRAYGDVFHPGALTLGLVAPLAAYPARAEPPLERHLERIQLAEELGFAAIWLRDVPFNSPTFGDAGQIFDPFVYLGALSAATSEIALGVASIILPLRHPAHVAKAAATADALSGGRLLLGVASGDRPVEYPAMNISFEDRGERFRDSVAYIRGAGGDYPALETAQGRLRGDLDMLPKPTGPRLPLLITGGSRQDPNWVAVHGDGWMTYPRDAASQSRIIADYRARIEDGADKPVMQSLYVDLVENPGAAPSPIHLGFRSGTAFLRGYLRELQRIGVNHVALNLRFASDDIETTMRRLANDILPEFHV